MIVQAVKRNNEWVIPNIPELQAQNEDHILLDVHVADARGKPANTEQDQRWTDEYLEKNWKRLGLATQSADLDDDERLMDAAIGFYNDKHSN